MSLYKILNIKITASSEQIKKAYFRLAQLHHPDKEGGDAEKFKQINEAYKVLMDEEKRKRYDAGEDLEDIMRSAQYQDQKILSMIAQTFCGVVSGCDPEHHDVIKLMKDQLFQTCVTTPQNISNMREQIMKYEKMINKIRSKSNNSIFSEIAQGQIEGLKKSIISAENHKKLVEEALNYLEDFSYEINDFEKIMRDHLNNMTSAFNF